MSESIVFPITDGVINNPLHSPGIELRRPWAAYVYRKMTTVVPASCGFLERDKSGQLIQISHVVRGAYLGFGAHILGTNGKEWQTVRNLFCVEHIDEVALTMRPIAEQEVPTLPDLDPLAHPGIQVVLAEIQETRAYLARLERMTLDIARRGTAPTYQIATP